MVKHLKQLKLLEGISVGDHDKFMLQFPIRKFAKGDKILHEGDPNTKIFGVVMVISQSGLARASFDVLNSLHP